MIYVIINISNYNVYELTFRGLMRTFFMIIFQIIFTIFCLMTNFFAWKTVTPKNSLILGWVWLPWRNIFSKVDFLWILSKSLIVLVPYHIVSCIVNGPLESINIAFWRRIASRLLLFLVPSLAESGYFRTLFNFINWWLGVFIFFVWGLTHITKIDFVIWRSMTVENFVKLVHFQILQIS